MRGMHQTGSVRGARPLTGPQAAMRARQIWPRGSSSVLRSAGGEFLLSASFADQIGTGDRRQHEKPIRQRLRYRNPCMWMGNSGAAARARARKNAAARAPAAPAQKTAALHAAPAPAAVLCMTARQTRHGHADRSNSSSKRTESRILEQHVPSVLVPRVGVGNAAAAALTGGGAQTPQQSAAPKALATPF